MCTIRLDGRIMEILACPFCKCQDLQIKHDHLSCLTCNAVFEIHPNGVVDFRVITPIRDTLFEKYWIRGQREFEQWAKRRPTDAQYYLKEFEDSQKEYVDFYDFSSIEGVFLDVGGSDGRLRQFLRPSPDLYYVSIDPHLDARESSYSAGRLKVYPVLADPCSFICGMAEHLPFTHNSVDFMRMNSVLDHLWDPYLGMREMVRVLKPGGLVFLGVYVTKEKTKWESRFQSLKDMAKVLLHNKDHHIWHPRIDELNTLVQAVGFEKVKEMAVDGGIVFLLKKPLRGYGQSLS